MRYLSYSLLVLVGILVLWMLRASFAVDSSSKNSLDDKDYRRVGAYEISEHTPIKLDFSSSAVTTKLLFYGLVAQANKISTKQNNENEEPYFKFSIEYRFGRSGPFRKVDLTTRLTEYRSIETNELMPAYRTDQPAFKVTDSQSLELGIPKSGAKTLEFRLASKDEALEGVVFRSYFSESRTLSDSERRWARLSRRDQNRLARFHPFGRHYLSRDEIQNVLSNRNQVIAPSGISGQEFVQRPLWSYQHPDLLINDSSPLGDAAPNLGIGLQQSLRVLDGAEVKIKYRVFNGKTANLSYHHRPLDGQPSQTILGEVVSEGYMVHRFSAGDYVFDADQLMRFDVEPSDAIQLSSLQRRFHPLDEQLVKYSLLPSRKRQLLKLELIAKAQEEFSVSYTFLDASDKVLLQADVQHFQPANSFTFYTKGYQVDGLHNQAHRLSNSSEKILKVPDEARRLVLSSVKNKGLIKLSNSLETLSPKLTLNGNRTHFRSNWFEIEPDRGDEPRSIANTKVEYGSALANVRSRNGIWLTNYERFSFAFESVEPQVQRLRTFARLPKIELLESVSVNHERKPSAIGYVPVKLNQTFEVVLKPPTQGDYSLALHALYRGNKSHPQNIVIDIDNQSYTFDLNSENGYLTLPPLKPGRHSLRVRSGKNLKLYMNHLSLGKVGEPESGFKKRQFTRSSSTISYSVKNLLNKGQALQILLASDQLVKPFEFIINAVNAEGERMVRSVEVVPDTVSHTRLHTLSSNVSYWQLPPIYVPLEVLGDFVPNQLDIVFNDRQSRLISAALVDRSQIKFSRAFADRLGLTQP